MLKAAQARNDPAYRSLKEFLIERTGLAYYQDRDDDLAERIGRRLKALRMNGYGPYAEMLHSQPAGKTELDLLIAELTIGETYFFRNSDQFDALRNVIVPAILDSNRERRTLRIWSAGCSNGAEAYSVSVLLRDEFAESIRGWELSIFGTDVNRRSLHQARQGLYQNWALREMDSATRSRLFQSEDGGWVIRDRYREGVAFQYHNLVKDAAPSLLNNLFAFDLVLCRNVMIYFDRPTIAAVVSRLRNSIVERGWLVAGHADIDCEAYQVFETVAAGDVSVYRKPACREPAAALGLPAPRPEILDDFAVTESHSPLAAGDGAWAPPPPTPAAAAEQASKPAPPTGPTIEKVRELADAGSWIEAEQCCAALLEILPLDPAPHFYSALIQGQTGRLVEAEKSLRRSIYLDRRFVLGHYHLGLLLQRNGETSDAARRCFANVQNLLRSIDGDFRFAHGDGITANCLREMTEMQLEVL